MADARGTLSTSFKLTEGGREVELEDGRRVRLDPVEERSRALAQVLEACRRERRPVYFEVDPETSVITGLRVAHVSRVLGVRRIDRATLDVALVDSHARHFLRDTAEDFAGMRERLDHAVRTKEPVILVSGDDQAVLEVRPAPPELRPFPERPPPRRARLPIDPLAILRRWRCWRWWPWTSWSCCVSWSGAREVFDDLAATSCAPLTVPAPCIPFLYPDDGCWGRAHEMCRLMRLKGLRPRKVWIQGWLNVKTRNSPSCEVYWGWHVAPTLCVRGTWPLPWLRRVMVIDPALFSAPVSQARWKAVQGDPTATLTDTDAAIFMLFTNETDPTNAKTEGVLSQYRLALQARAAGAGPPPYSHCP